MNTTPTTPASSNQRRRKLMAIAAGGVVLGIGTAVTLASWTDNETATGDFAAGQFAMESSQDGTAFTDTTPAGQALKLSFSELASNLSPQDETSAIYALRLAPGSDYQAAVSGYVESSGSAADNLSYTIQRVSDIAGTETVGAPLVSGEALDGGTTHENMFTLDALDTVVYLKVTVAADDGLAQNETATATWNLTGTSGESLS
ncbi:SipW-dependent-type signal peptide-containing protein [Glutamicibacter sp.]|uniref:SipW-dependent-type signal peptide-containing protein n=1 Tax=Glutamicibacter sp. TaxID=1931995 RepID=UPI003D6A0385